MLLDVTLWVMDSRKVAGDIVREEIARQGMRQAEAATKARMSKSTLAQVLKGAPVEALTLRQVEGLLGFPRRFLTHVVDGDIAAIEGLQGLDPDLRRLALAALSVPGERVLNDRPASGA